MTLNGVMALTLKLNARLGRPLAIDFLSVCLSVCQTRALSHKKIIRRWDSERELFTTTSYVYYKVYKVHKLCLSRCLL